MGYRRLTAKDRCQIEVLVRNGFGVRRIARELGVSPSSISRELTRNSKKYAAEVAGAKAKKRISSRHLGKFKIRGDLKRSIREKLLQDWSPDQIAEDLSRRKKAKVSAKSIYRYIARDKLKSGSLTSHLRILRKQRKDRTSPKWRPAVVRIYNRKPIQERPKIVNKRSRLGDIERDTVFGVHNGPLLLTMVDRKSRYTRIAWIPKKCSELVHQATVEALKGTGVKTITNDNGPEFAKHEKTSKELNAQIYFSRAYASWERGTNENTNGLLRQYFPRKQDIGQLTKRQVTAIENKLNDRPRKCLGYLTPREISRMR